MLLPFSRPGTAVLVLVLLFGSAILPPSQPARAETAVLGAPVSVGAAPSEIAVNPVNNHVYVTQPANNSVAVLDAITNTLITTIAGFHDPRGVAVNPDTGLVYVANCSTN